MGEKPRTLKLDLSLFLYHIDTMESSPEAVVNGSRVSPAGVSPYQ